MKSPDIQKFLPVRPNTKAKLHFLLRRFSYHEQSGVFGVFDCIVPFPSSRHRPRHRRWDIAPNSARPQCRFCASSAEPPPLSAADHDSLEQTESTQKSPTCDCHADQYFGIEMGGWMAIERTAFGEFFRRAWNGTGCTLCDQSSRIKFIRGVPRTPLPLWKETRHRLTIGDGSRSKPWMAIGNGEHA
jgi:hypothetical protein